jgi:FAD synthetase
VGKKAKTVLASGTFDLLHMGHVKYLEEAKKVGGKNAKLFVVVARDDTVKEMKGKEPVMPEDQRRLLVEALKVVDKAILGSEKFDIGKIIKDVKPDLIAIGYDQESIERKVRKEVVNKKLNIQIMRIRKFGKDVINSSSKIKRKISGI